MNKQFLLNWKHSFLCSFDLYRSYLDIDGPDDYFREFIYKMLHMFTDKNNLPYSGIRVFSKNCSYNTQLEFIDYLIKYYDLYYLYA
jgi:hypothetical protein